MLFLCVEVLSSLTQVKVMKACLALSLPTYYFDLLLQVQDQYNYPLALLRNLMYSSSA